MISFFGAKVKADLENPHYHKNRQTLKQMTKDKIKRMSMRKVKGSEYDDDEDEYDYSSEEDEV